MYIKYSQHKIQKHAFLYVLWVFTTFLHLVALWIFTARFCIPLCHEYFQRVSVFSCIMSIWSLFLYLGALLVFAAHFCVCLLSLQCVSAFCCVVSICSISIFCCNVNICSVFLYLVVLYLQRISEFGRTVTSSMFLNLVGLWVFAWLQFDVLKLMKMFS